MLERNTVGPDAVNDALLVGRCLRLSATSPRQELFLLGSHRKDYIERKTKGQQLQKNPRAHKNKIGTPPPPKTQNNTPPLKRGILWTWVFPSRKNAFFPGVHKIDAPISGPRIADRNFTDTGAFLKTKGQQLEGKIVSTLFSHFLALFHTFSHFFRVFQKFSSRTLS